MVLDIIDYTGDALLAENPFIDSFGSNCIKLKTGEIVNFIKTEKEDFTPSDIRGIGAYIRLDPNITYTDQPERQTSCAPKVLASMPFRLVVFQVNAIENKLHPVKLENKIASDLLKISFGSYTGKEQSIRITHQSSNLNFYDNFVSEVGKEYNVGADSVIIALNCTLEWIKTDDNCDADCNVYEDNTKCNG